MPKVELQRHPHGSIEGIQYNGENIHEIIDYYFMNKSYVFINSNTKAIETRGEDGESITVGEWIVNDEGTKRILTSAQFNKSYRLKEAPAGYKFADLTKEAETGTYSIR